MNEKKLPKDQKTPKRYPTADEMDNGTLIAAEAQAPYYATFQDVGALAIPSFLQSLLGRITFNRMTIIQLLREGLPFKSFEMLQEKLDLPRKDLAEIINVPERTLARRKQEERLPVDESERIYRIGSLFDRATIVMGNELAARKWLKTPNRALGGVPPLEFADTEPGAREVEDLLGRLEHGVFS